MSKNPSCTIGKSPSESCQLGKTSVQTTCGEPKESKSISKGVFGSSDLTLPYDSNIVYLSSINKSKKLLKATRKILEREFKAQIAPHGSVLPHTLEVLKHRFSTNFRKLLPIRQKSDCPSRRSHSHLNKLPVCEPELPDRDWSVSFPALTATNKTLTTALPQRQNCSVGCKVDYSSIISVASRTHLACRYEIRDYPCKLIEKQNNPELREDTNDKLQVYDILRPSIPYFNNDTEVDLSVCPRIQRNDSNISKNFLSTRNWNSRKASLYKDFSPLVPGSGGAAAYSPACLSSPAVVNLRIPGKYPQLKQSSSRQLFWRFGKARSDKFAVDTPAVEKSPSPGGFPGQYTGFHTRPELTRSFPDNAPNTSQSEYFDWADPMGSNRRQTKQQQVAATHPIGRPTGITEHHSFVNLPSSFHMPVGNFGHIRMQTKSTQLRNSKSFHGEARDGMSEPNFRVSNGTARGQARASPPRSMSNGSTVVLRQHQTRKMLERQKMKILKPLNVTKNQNNVNDFCELGQEYSSPALPGAGTASYRLTHDVSFDEGSRYRGEGVGAMNNYKSIDGDIKNGSNRRRIAYAGNDDQRFDKLPDPYNRERPGPLAGQTPTLSLIRVDDRQNPPFAFAAPPGSRGHSAQVTNNSPVPMQPASASRPTPFRVSKEARQSWNHRMGDLSVNGGGYYGSSPIQPGGRVDTSGLASLSINPSSSFTQKNVQSRDKIGVTSTKSRLSSRYGNRYEGTHSYSTSAGKEVSYADPCIGAPCSFQQRLTELSILESDTIKYEKSRKTKRRSKQDKDS